VVARMIVPRGRVMLEVGPRLDVGRLKFQNSSVLYPDWPRGGSTKYRCWSKLTTTNKAHKDNFYRNSYRSLILDILNNYFDDTNYDIPDWHNVALKLLIRKEIYPYQKLLTNLSS
jgi:hypothetical protein